MKNNEKDSNKLNDTNISEKKGRRGKAMRPTYAGWCLLMVFMFILYPYVNSALFDSGSKSTEKIHGVIKDSEDDTFLEGTYIEILDENLSVWTNEKGEYEIENVPTGEIKVKFYQEGYRVEIITILLYDGYNYKLNVKLDYDIGIAEAKELENGNIKGNIVNQTSSKPITNANIEVLNSNLSTKTDNDGNFIITNLSAGIIEIKVTKENFNSSYKKLILQQNETETVNFKLNSGNGEDIFDDISGKFGVLKGTVKGNDNSVISGVKIFIKGINQTVNTSSNGSFLIKIPYGKYKVKANIENYQTVYKNVIITDESIINFTLKKGKEPIEKSEVNDFLNMICYVVIGIIAVFILIGSICAFKKKLYTFSLLSCVFGIILGLQNPIAMLLSFVAIFLIATSKEEFIS